MSNQKTFPSDNTMKISVGVGGTRVENSPSNNTIMNTKPTLPRALIHVAGQIRRAVVAFRSTVVRRWLGQAATPRSPLPSLPSAESGAFDQKQLNGHAPDGDALDQRLPKPLAESKASPRFQERLTVKSNGRIVFVRIEDIDWIGAAHNYVDLHVGTQSYRLREKLSVLESRLAPEKFVRISRSTIVNIERLKELQSVQHGAYVAILQDGTQLKLCRKYRDQLKQFGLR